MHSRRLWNDGDDGDADQGGLFMSGCSVAMFQLAEVSCLANVLCNQCTHQELSQIIRLCHFDEEIGQGLSKPKRIVEVLLYEQNKVGSGACVLRFVKEIISPCRFVGKTESFSSIRGEINKILLFHGIEFTAECKFRNVEHAQTPDEVDQRINGLVGKLRQRGCHSEVLKYCTREFMSEDYFHGILEAAKGVCQHLRELTGLAMDGGDLIAASFGIKNPLLAFNTLTTESEQSEQKGISSLFLGCHQFLRNPRAHAPRKLWRDETNVLDCLTFISLLHRILDQCVRVPKHET